MKNKYTRLFCLLLLSLFATQTLSAQNAPVIQWQKLIGGSIKQAPNGDIILGSGQTVSRLNQLTGAVLWQASLPTSYEGNYVYDLIVTNDGSIVTLAKDRTRWSLIKLDATGTVLWNTSFTGATQSGDIITKTFKNLIQALDGGYAVISSTLYGRNGSATTLYKFDAASSNTKTVDVGYPYSNPFRPSSVGNKIISTTDGGFLIVGRASSGADAVTGWATKLDQNLNQIWNDRYTFATEFSDVIPSPFDSNAFITAGRVGDQSGTTTLVISPTQSGLNNTGGIYRPSFFNLTFTNYPNEGIQTNAFPLPKIVSNNANSFEVLDEIDQRSGDIRITSFGAANQTRWTKILGGSAADLTSDVIGTQDGGYLLAGLTQSNDGDVQGNTANNVSGWLVKLIPGTALALTQPSYDCDRGSITFITTGGDGSPITYSAPGVSRQSATSNTGFVEQGLRNDPKPITITATQNGYSTNYVFDFKAYCLGIITPTLKEPIPDQFRPVNVQIISNIIPINSYFNGVPSFKSFRPIVNYRADGLPPGLILFDSSNESQQLAYIGGTPTVTGTYSVTITAYVSNALAPQPSTSTTFRITITDSPVVTPPPTTGGTLTLTQPTYDCSTGAITFNSTGGNGSTITYSAPGITRSSATSNTGTVEQGLRNDPKTILITATQSGQTATYSFDFKSFCSGNPPTPTPTPPGNALTLVSPTYNCSTGAITFNYTGGNGSAVEFQAAGITGWTTNPNQFVDKDSRTANDVKPFTLMARQNGQVVTYTWDLKAACGRSARVAAGEAGQGLQLTVKGNPVGNTAIVDISGVDGQSVQLDLLNASGHVLEQRHIEQAGAVEEQRFDLQRQSSGVLFLRAQSGQQRQTVKLIKQ